MRSLSARQAARCETARHPRCKCRCGGQLHGAARFDGLDGPAELAEDDPHHAPPPPRATPPPPRWIQAALFPLDGLAAS